MLSLAHSKVFSQKFVCVSCVIWEKRKVSPIFFCIVHTTERLNKSMKYSAAHTFKKKLFSWLILISNFVSKAWKRKQIKAD